MKYIGIVAEYNPFHSGHHYQIQQTKQQIEAPTTVVAVMSGNWVQQADCAIADKWTRAQLAVEGGVDLVLELQTPWATASAERFCSGAVSLLSQTGLIQYLSFGSECGDIEPLKRVATCLNGQEFANQLKLNLKEGTSFAAARQKTVTQLIGLHGEVLQSPNNTLAIEYLRALDNLQSAIIPITIKREGAEHNAITQSHQTKPRHTSASDLRQKIKEGNWDYVEHYTRLANHCGQGSQIPSIAHCERAVLAKLMTLSVKDWERFQDSGVGEGLPSRLVKAAEQATTLDGFYTIAKTKRYTHARLRRLALRTFLDMTIEKTPDTIPYIKVLAFNHAGAQALKEMKQTATLPIITKPAHVKKLDLVRRDCFEQERIYTDLFGLCHATSIPKGEEWTKTPIYIRKK